MGAPCYQARTAGGGSGRAATVRCEGSAGALRVWGARRRVPPLQRRLRWGLPT